MKSLTSGEQEALDLVETHLGIGKVMADQPIIKFEIRNALFKFSRATNYADKFFWCSVLSELYQQLAERYKKTAKAQAKHIRTA